MKDKNLKILLIGNPNCGKSTVFNTLVGGNAKVGNYTGVTVDIKSGVFKVGEESAKVVDLPGIYSLIPSSPEEAIVRDLLGEGDFDLIANVVDSTNLERNLFLTLQLAEMRQPMVLVLNMTDELEKKGLFIDAEILSKILDIPVIKVVGYRASSVNGLKTFLLDCAKKKIEPAFPWSKFKNQDMYETVSEISHAIKANLPIESASWSRLIAIRALEGDPFVSERISPALSRLIKDASKKIEESYGEAPVSLISAARFSLAADMVSKALSSKAESAKGKTMLSFDKVLLNPYFGLPIFALLMYATFQFIFTLGDPVMGFMEGVFAHIGKLVGGFFPDESAAQSLFRDGIIGGVGGVLVFLPNILFLFLALSILEDSGYMARVALLFDRIMRRFGLSGSSIIPMLVGFGCTVPAIMATRTLKSKSERLATIIVLPLFSCGARFPVYVLLIPIFFPAAFQGLAMFGVYIAGIVLAMIGAKILRLTALRGEESGFIVELPPYRMPRMRNMFIQIGNRAWAFLKRAGTLIFGISVLLWIVSTYPQKPELSKDYEALVAQVEADNTLDEDGIYEKKYKIRAEENSEIFDYTISGRVGKFLEPILSPLGFDKKISGALLAALAAKEVFVSQLGIVYGMDEVDEESPSLRDRIKEDYSPIQGMSIILFILISMPCVATAAATYSETKSIRAVIAQLGGLTLLAYIVCLIFYQTAKLFI